MRDVVVRKGDKHHNNNIVDKQQSNFPTPDLVETSKKFCSASFERARTSTGTSTKYKVTFGSRGTRFEEHH